MSLCLKEFNVLKYKINILFSIANIWSIKFSETLKAAYSNSRENSRKKLFTGLELTNVDWSNFIQITDQKIFQIYFATNRWSFSRTSNRIILQYWQCNESNLSISISIIKQWLPEIVEFERNSNKIMNYA